MINSFSNFGNTLSQESPASLRQLHNSKMSFAQSCLRVTWLYTKTMYRRNKVMHLVVLLWMLWFVVRVVNVVTKRKAGISPTKESTIILFTLPPFFRRGILNKLWRQLICPVFFFLFFLIFFSSTEVQDLTHTSYSENCGEHYTLWKNHASALQNILCFNLSNRCSWWFHFYRLPNSYIRF
jgi:hypothetical protein